MLQLLLVIQNFYAHNFSLSNISFDNFFKKMAETYTDIDIKNTFASWMISYTGWTKVIALAGGSFYFKNQSKTLRYLYFGLIFLILFNVVFFVGSQKQIIDLIIYIIIPLFLKNVCDHKKIKLGKKIKYIIIIFVIVIIVGNLIIARRQLWADRYHSSAIVSIGTVNFDNWMFKIFPGNFGLIFTQFINYTSQGYQGLSLCLKLPFEWAYGMGSSFKFMNDFSRWFDIPLNKIEVSYPVRMESAFGVDAYSYWHTVFPWLASDFTWIGSILVICIYIFFWAKAWGELRTLKNLPALLLFTQLSILVLYIPCNNQLFQTRESIVSTMVLILFWFLFHGRTEQDKPAAELGE
ncbi:MAG: hypothetical protein ACLSVG_00490 [Clostridia bacterium]